MARCGLVSAGMLLLTGALFLSSALADAAAPGRIIEDTVAQVRSKVTAQTGKMSPPQLDQALRDIIAPVFDFDTMAKSCLGPQWKKATPEQQQEFVELFSNLLARTYLKKIRENAAESTFSLLGEKIKGDLAIVRTKVLYDESQTAAIEYHMERGNGAWRVVDVLIENIGLVSNYRSEFAGIVKNENMEGLLVKLREKEKAGAT